MIAAVVSHRQVLVPRVPQATPGGVGIGLGEQPMSSSHCVAARRARGRGTATARRVKTQLARQARFTSLHRPATCCRSGRRKESVATQHGVAAARHRHRGHRDAATLMHSFTVRQRDARCRHELPRCRRVRVPSVVRLIESTSSSRVSPHLSFRAMGERTAWVLRAAQTSSSWAGPSCRRPSCPRPRPRQGRWALHTRA